LIADFPAPRGSQKELGLFDLQAANAARFELDQVQGKVRRSQELERENWQLTSFTNNSFLATS
jgi:hypothetical protein